MAVMTEDGYILDISPSAIDVIGAAGNLIGRSLFDFVRREDRGAVKAALSRALEGDRVHVSQDMRAEFRLLRLRRAPALAEISLKPVGRGRLMGLIRERGDELAQLRRARIFKEEAEAKKFTARKAPVAAPVTAPISAPAAPDRRADLMADLGHELKTPLNAIMGFAETMREETFGPLGHEKYAEYAALIHSSGAHLLDLIGAILDQAKVEAGRYSLSPVLSAPDAVARECAAMIEGEAEKAGLAVTLNIARNLPETMIDKRAVRQILINLLSNAVKFTAAGGIVVTVREKCGAIDYIVADTGVGMSQTAIAKLGERFTDIHKNGVRGTKGSGLGLSLAFSLAKLHGGALKLKSEPGEGTIATLTLPVRKSLAAFESAAARMRSTSGDIQSQLDRVNAYRRERANKAA